jgi:hypothetical protein
MAGLVPVIHGFARASGKDVDGRDTRGHDDRTCGIVSGTWSYLRRGGDFASGNTSGTAACGDCSQNVKLSSM